MGEITATEAKQRHLDGNMIFRGRPRSSITTSPLWLALKHRQHEIAKYYIQHPQTNLNFHRPSIPLNTSNSMRLPPVEYNKLRKEYQKAHLQFPSYFQMDSIETAEPLFHEFDGVQKSALPENDSKFIPLAISAPVKKGTTKTRHVNKMPISTTLLSWLTICHLTDLVEAVLKTGKCRVSEKSFVGKSNFIHDFGGYNYAKKKYASPVQSALFHKFWDIINLFILYQPRNTFESCFTNTSPDFMDNLSQTPSMPTYIHRFLIEARRHWINTIIQSRIQYYKEKSILIHKDVEIDAATGLPLFEIQHIHQRTGSLNGNRVQLNPEDPSWHRDRWEGGDISSDYSTRDGNPRDLFVTVTEGHFGALRFILLGV